MTAEERRQERELDQKALEFARTQFEICFKTPQGQYVLSFIGDQICGYLGRIENEEDAIRHNVFLEILKTMGLDPDRYHHEMVEHLGRFPVP